MRRLTQSKFAALGVLIVMVSTGVWAQGPSDPERYAYGSHMMWSGSGWFGMIFGLLFMILVFALVVALAVFLVRWLGDGPMRGSTGKGPTTESTALDILKQRYARGEIDKEEFEERRRILNE